MKTVPDIQIHTEEGVVLDYINPIITKERILECIELVQKALIPFIDEDNEWLPDIKSIKVCFKLDSKGPPAYVISSDEFRSLKYSELYLNVSYFEGIVNRRLKSNSHVITPSKLTSVQATNNPMEVQSVTADARINFSLLDAQLKDDLIYETYGVLCHELVHVYQWSGMQEKAPWWFIEGFADYIRNSVGYPAKHWNPTQVLTGFHDSGDDKFTRGYVKGYEKAGYFFKWICDKFDKSLILYWNQNLKRQGWTDSIPEIVIEFGGLDLLYEGYEYEVSQH